MEPQDILTNQKKVVDRLHEVQQKAESGKFTDALAIIKEVKAADAKNIYLIAIEKQIAKLCDSSLAEEIRSGIVKSLPSMLDRAIGDIQRRASAAKPDESQKEQKEAALEKLKSQYFQRADDYVEKHEYQRALEEIRRIYIIEPGSIVAKEYEQKIEQLAVLHDRSEAEKAASAEKEKTRAKAKETKTEAKEIKAEVEKPKTVVPDIETPKEKYVLIEEEKKSKLPVLIAAAAAVLAVGSWLIFSQGSSSDNIQTNQEQTQQPPPVEDSIVIQTPTAAASTTQPKESTSIAESTKQPSKNEKKQPESRPITQTKRPAQPAATPQETAQPTSTKPKTTKTPPPATQTQQSAQQPTQQPAQQPAQQPTQQPAQQPAQQPSTKTSAPAPMPFVAIETPPGVIKRVAPVYPEIAIKMGIQGRVTVEVTIDPQGKPIQTKVVKSPSEIFNNAAVEAVMKYTFKPAMQSTGPVTSKLYIPIDFRLK